LNTKKHQIKSRNIMDIKVLWIYVFRVKTSWTAENGELS